MPSKKHKNIQFFFSSIGATLKGVSIFSTQQLCLNLAEDLNFLTNLATRQSYQSSKEQTWV